MLCQNDKTTALDVPEEAALELPARGGGGRVVVAGAGAAGEDGADAADRRRQEAERDGEGEHVPQQQRAEPPAALRLREGGTTSPRGKKIAS